MERINNLLDVVGGIESSFYEPVIKLHTNLRLRGFAERNGDLSVYKLNPRDSTVLVFGDSGFVLQQERIRGSYGEAGYKESCKNPYDTQNGRLIAVSINGRVNDMLNHFPGITVGDIESGLESAIKGSKLYQRGVV